MKSTTQKKLHTGLGSKMIDDTYWWGASGASIYGCENTILNLLKEHSGTSYYYDSYSPQLIERRLREAIITTRLFPYLTEWVYVCRDHDNSQPACKLRPRGELLDFSIPQHEQEVFNLASEMSYTSARYQRTETYNIMLYDLS